MYYDIVGLCPRLGQIGGHGFRIKLYREWKVLVANRELTQEQVDTVIDNQGRTWLDACGYGSIFDPDNCGIHKNPKKPAGPDARPLYNPGQDLRVTWGDWGPEHITVPGNACGLDLSNVAGAPRDGRVLSPHNIDNTNQKLLLLVVFSWFANDLVLHWDAYRT